MEDDIDRMIAEMQNKPYDSSRYLENQNNLTSQSNSVPNNQFANKNSNMKAFIDTRPKYPTDFQQQNLPMSQSMAYDPRLNRFQ